MASAVGWLRMGTAASNMQMLHGQLLLFPFGVGDVRPSIDTALTKQAEKVGVGQGVMQAEVGNLTALVKIIMPGIYLKAYTFGSRRGLESLPFTLYSVCFIATAGLFSTVNKDQL